MLSFPSAKINLGLHVISKREDGYHNIDTCFYPVGWSDVLEIVKADEFKFTQSGLIVDAETEDNLCVKAFRLLATEQKVGSVHMHLHKVIPMGAGLGGGSADAAHTLKMLNEIFKLKLSIEKLLHYASLLGSDCAFFIEDKPSIGKGKGNELNAIDLNMTGKFIVIIKPEIHINTAEAYASLSPQIPEVPIEDLLKMPIDDWKKNLKNDFEGWVFVKYPEIKKIKERLYEKGAVYASMSGSGAGVFGIFNSAIDLDEFKSYTQWAGFANF